MVSQFPLDAMHLIDLGVLKRVVESFLYQMTRGGKRKACDEKTLSMVYASYRKDTPSEFNRKPRLLSDFKQFKATEFRQFGLYTGMVYLKRYLTVEGYYQFLCLCLAYRIISSETDEHLLQKAQSMLEVFVANFTVYFSGVSLGYITYCR